jgi:hypothetical protein
VDPPPFADRHNTSLWCGHEASPKPENSGEPRRIQESPNRPAKLRTRRFGIRGEFPAIKFSAALLSFSRPNTRPKSRTIPPKELWGGSPVQIPSAPHLSLQEFGRRGELIEIRACARASARDRARDTSRPVVLIGFQKQENLGLEYLAATLSVHGYEVLVLDFEQDAAEILAHLKGRDPLIVGFSLIFQFYLPRFQALVRLLRRADVRCHFTMGGHFPSLSYQHALDFLPVTKCRLELRRELPSLFQQGLDSPVSYFPPAFSSCF